MKYPFIHQMTVGLKVMLFSVASSMRRSAWVNVTYVLSSDGMHVGAVQTTVLFVWIAWSRQRTRASAVHELDAFITEYV